MSETKWARLLAYVTGLVNHELLLQNEYLAAENRILKGHLPRRFQLSNGERTSLAEIGRRLGRKGLQQVACIAKPDTILAGHRKLIAQKFDGSQYLDQQPRYFAEWLKHVDVYIGLPQIEDTKSVIAGVLKLVSLNVRKPGRSSRYAQYITLRAIFIGISNSGGCRCEQARLRLLRKDALGRGKRGLRTNL